MYLEKRVKGTGTLDGNNALQVQAVALILW
jgi:hypothetical protein